MYNLPTPKRLHYLNRYIKFISARIDRTALKLGYTESHHILPRSYGGSNDIKNIISLTGREHYIAHWILWKAYDDYCMTKAFMIMHSANYSQIRTINSRIYEKLKIKYSEMQSISMTGNKNTFYNKKHSDASKKKMSESKVGINNSWNTGLTKESSEKLKEVGKSISESVKGMRHWTNGIDEVKSKSCPGEGWYIGRKPNENFKLSDERKLQIKLRQSGGNSAWWNNGVVNKRCKYKPDGDDWVKGRLMSPELYTKFCKKHQIT